MQNLSVYNGLWSGSINEAGKVLQGADAIKQQVYVAISTVTGGDALRPFFGTNIFSYQDKNVNLMTANVKNEIYQAIKSYVPGVVVKSIKETGDNNGGVSFTVLFVYNEQLLTVSTASVAGGLISIGAKPDYFILEGDVPANSLLYNITVSVKGKALTPVMPGFTSMSAMSAWANSNWSEYGYSGYGYNKILFYLKSSKGTGSIQVYTHLVLADVTNIPDGDVIITSIAIGGITDNTERLYANFAALLTFLNGDFKDAHPTAITGTFAISSNRLFYSNPEQYIEGAVVFDQGVFNSVFSDVFN